MSARPSTRPGSFHGTMNGYQNRDCRCDRCRRAATEYMAAKRARAAATRTCPNCGGPGGIHTDGLCHTCYEYRLRTGRERPEHVYNPPPRTCVNCGFVMPRGKGLRHGRCEACSRYLSRNGTERPPYLWANTRSVA